ncbi:MAG: hypothetical protein KBS44_06265 [Clostridiales bacterium]|nr:hypothetical protein [Candidatus Coliplasma equi]
MGFLDAVKAANLPNLGLVNSPDFHACYLVKKDENFAITGAKSETYEFSKSDVTEFKILCAGGDWINYKMKLKDGKIAIIHSFVETKTSANQTGAHSAPLERYFGDML